MTMMTAEDYKPASLEELYDALDALVTELVSCRQQERQRQRERTKDEPLEPFRTVSAAELFKVPRDILHQRSIVEKPVEWALKSGIKEIGRMLYDLCGSTDELVRIAEDVCDRDSKRYGQRISIVDSTFNGIGSGNDVWVS